MTAAKDLDCAVERYVAELSAKDQGMVKTLRNSIKKISKQLPLCGELCESLKWGELSFSTESPKNRHTGQIDAPAR